MTVFSPELLKTSQDITQKLRANKINTDLYPDSEEKLPKQLKYGNNNQIPFVLMVGPDEAAENVVTLKNMTTAEQKTLTLNQVINILK